VFRLRSWREKLPQKFDPQLMSSWTLCEHRLECKLRGYQSLDVLFSNWESAKKHILHKGNLDRQFCPVTPPIYDGLHSFFYNIVWSIVIDRNFANILGVL
jgi:hypothetical protein